jgi:hypothetical protein
VLKRKNQAFCILNGSNKIIEYHAACRIDIVHPYDADIFNYIGDGIVVEVLSRVQSGKTKLSFFRRKR